jgi:3-deoxy-D-manno-octulosonic acid kinase
MSPIGALGHDHLHLFPATSPHEAMGMLYDPVRCGAEPTPGLLEPRFYGSACLPVSQRGGRGSAWFVEASFGAAVLRHYRRGGLLARVNAERYLWLGVENARCTREYRLLRTMHSQGLPVPAPLAAGWWRHGMFYRQALLTERIPDALSLAELMLRNPQRTPWEAVGQVIARFHRAGVWHADLNAHNILRDARGHIWLIDFDRCTQGVASEQEREQNLLRLRRSLQKLGADDGEAGWQRLYTAWLIAMDEAQTLPSV